MRHDAGRALAADYPPIDRVVAVAVDVADPAVLQMHPDAAAAGAHVTGGGLDLVGGRHGQRNVRFMMCHRAVLRLGRKGNVHASPRAYLGMLFSFNSAIGIGSRQRPSLSQLWVGYGYR